jgi:hypothetical protein
MGFSPLYPGHLLHCRQELSGVRVNLGTLQLLGQRAAHSVTSLYRYKLVYMILCKKHHVHTIA